MKADVKTVYELVSVNTNKRTGVFRFKAESPKNAKWNTINVSISGLLASRIQKGRLDGLVRPQTYVGTKFTSTLTSQEFSENPFRLTKFVPSEGSDVPVNYNLALVIERFTPKEALEDALGNRIELIRRFKRNAKEYYLRFVVKDCVAMLKDLADSVVIVTP
jgi:hypothetical protein